MSFSKARLFSWNPEEWKDINFDKNISKNSISKKLRCKYHQQIKAGDIIYMINGTGDPKGIFARGIAVKVPYPFDTPLNFIIFKLSPNTA